MQQEQLIEHVIEALIGVKIHFHQEDVTVAKTIEYRNPERRIIHGCSFPKSPELAKNWQRYLDKKDLSFPSFWQCAIGFCRYYREKGGL